LENQTNKELSKAFKQKYHGKTLIVTLEDIVDKRKIEDVSKAHFCNVVTSLVLMYSY
jgi:hypothetical protein